MILVIIIITIIIIIIVNVIIIHLIVTLFYLDLEIALTIMQSQLKST